MTDKDVIINERDELRRAYEVAQHQLAALQETAQKLATECDQLRKETVELKAVNKRLVDQLWGRRSERRVPDPNQPLLPGAEDWLSDDERRPNEIVVGDEIQEVADLELLKKAEHERCRRREQRKLLKNRPQELPSHLERRERLLDLPDDQKVGLTFLRDEITERLRFERPCVYVERTIRRLYVQKNAAEQGVISMPAPLAIVAGCKYDFSVIAAMIGLKWAFHQSTYRQQDWFSQCGWFPRRSTINDLFGYATGTVGPLVRQMWHTLLLQSLLMIDETRVRLLTRDALSEEQMAQLRKRSAFSASDEGESAAMVSKGSVNSYAWIFSSPDFMAPYNLFHWSLTRQHSVLDAILENYHGDILGDGYTGYAHIERRTQGRIKYAACNTHARREFVKSEQYEPILCAQIEAYYRQLSQVEALDKGLAIDELTALRQREAAPIWHAIDRWRQSESVKHAALPSTPFGKAVGYLNNHGDALRRYVHDGRLPISNDQVERTVRPLTVGRRNWLFLGHPDAAQSRMDLLSVVSSAHRHNLMIDSYLTDVLTQLADAQQNHPEDLEIDSPYLEALLPDRWATAHPQFIRVERVSEKQDVAEAKRIREAKRRQEYRVQQRAAQAAASAAPEGSSTSTAS